MFVHLYVKIIHSPKLVTYLHVQSDNPWYNYYVAYCTNGFTHLTPQRSKDPDKMSYDLNIYSLLQ